MRFLLDAKVATKGRHLPTAVRAIFVAAFGQGKTGPDLFRAACTVGLEGLVSKRADRPYRAGRSKDWIKVKNRKHPTYRRLQDHRSSNKFTRQPLTQG